MMLRHVVLPRWDGNCCVRSPAPGAWPPLHARERLAGAHKFHLFFPTGSQKPQGSDRTLPVFLCAASRLIGMTIERERAVDNAVDHIGGECLRPLGVAVEQRAVELELVLIQPVGAIALTIQTPEMQAVSVDGVIQQRAKTYCATKRSARGGTETSPRRPPGRFLHP